MEGTNGRAMASPGEGFRPVFRGALRASTSTQTMKRISVNREFVWIGLLVAAAASGCGSSPQGDMGGGAATGGGPGAAGSAIAGSGGSAGQNDQSGTGGVVGTAGVSAGAAGAEDAAVAGDGAAGATPEAGTSDAGGPMPGSDAGSAPCT